MSLEEKVESPCLQLASTPCGRSHKFKMEFYRQPLGRSAVVFLGVFGTHQGRGFEVEELTFDFEVEESKIKVEVEE